MNYYQFHIGDYSSHTAHLEPLEDIAYRRMLDMYYRTEQPLPSDWRLIARAIRMRDNGAEIESVLSEFFTLTDDGWVNVRADREIQAYKRMATGGAKGAAKRWGKGGDGVAIGGASPPHADPNANHEPITNNQEPLIQEANASLSAAKLPDCPHQQILSLWKAKCPMLAQPRTWEGSRRANLKARWVQAAKPSVYSPEGYKTEIEGLEWWGSFFQYIAESKLGKGFESAGRCWRPDLEWVVNSTNFQKIIDGKYE